MTVRNTSHMVVRVDRVDEMIASVQELTRREILVGIPQATAGRQGEPGGEPVDNATLGYIHEFGSPDANIPPRPFLIPGVQEARDQIGKRLEAAARQAIDGNTEAMDDQMSAAGMVAQSAVRRKITEGPHTPLSPRTLAKRRAKGRTGERPLIDTGQLRRSITYVVRDKKPDGQGTP